MNPCSQLGLLTFYVRTATVKNLLTPLFLLEAICLCNTLTADETSLENQLARLGVLNLVSVSDVEASKVSGQGFAHHFGPFTYAASRSASALPGTFIHNFADALGKIYAEAESSALSEYDYTATSAHEPGGIGSPALHPDWGWHPISRSGSHHWSEGTRTKQISVGSNGFAFVSNN